MPSVIYYIISLFAIFQIVIISLVIGFKQKLKNTENKIFVAFLMLNAILISLSLINIYADLSIIQFNILLIISLSGFLLLGPFFLMFFQNVLNPEFKSRKAHLITFIAVLIISVFILILKSSSKSDSEIIFTSRQLYIIGIIIYIQLLLYIIQAFRLLTIYKMNIEKQLSVIKIKSLLWLRVMVSVYLLHWLFEVLAYFTPYFVSFENNENLWFSIIAILLLLFFLTLTFIRGIQGFGLISGNSHSIKYNNSGLSPETKEQIKEKLLDLIHKEKPYLNPELKIVDIAESINVSVKSLSQVINESFKSNFFDFINNQRIQYAKNLMLEDKINGNKLTIQQIFYDSGFNSKSAFNRAFKKFTQQTPSEFRNQQLS